MNVVLVRNYLLIHSVGFHSLRAKLALQNVHERIEEILRKLISVRARVLSEQQHLPLMGFGVDVTFEAVFIATLLLTHLTVPKIRKENNVNFEK